MKEVQPHVLCWDLDETIGNFRRISYEIEGKSIPEWERPLGLRYGIKELLEEFSEKNGYVHYITTSATFEYARRALKKSRLAKHFKHIFDRTCTSAARGKNYRPVAQELGYSDEDMRARMIAIGDAPGDRPVDSNIVSVDLGPGSGIETLVIREIITTLLDRGNGHFIKGFECLYEEAIPQFPDEEPEYQNRVFDLGGGISFSLEYQTVRPYYSTEEKVIPVITRIQAPDYEKPFQPITPRWRSF